MSSLRIQNQISQKQRGEKLQKITKTQSRKGESYCEDKICSKQKKKDIKVTKKHIWKEKNGKRGKNQAQNIQRKDPKEVKEYSNNSSKLKDKENQKYEDNIQAQHLSFSSGKKNNYNDGSRSATASKEERQLFKDITDSVYNDKEEGNHFEGVMIEVELSREDREDEEEEIEEEEESQQKQQLKDEEDTENKQQDNFQFNGDEENEDEGNEVKEDEVEVRGGQGNNRAYGECLNLEYQEGDLFNPQDDINFIGDMNQHSPSESAQQTELLLSQIFQDSNIKQCNLYDDQDLLILEKRRQDYQIPSLALLNYSCNFTNFPKKRGVLIDWLLEVSASLNFKRETLQQAVSIMDRYFAGTPQVNKSQLQLIGATSLFISHKIEVKSSC